MNRIQLELLANDRMTPALVLMNKALQDASGKVHKVNDALAGLNKAAGQMDGLHGKFKAIGQGLLSIAGGAALGAIAAATAAVWKLTGAINAAGKEQTRTLMTVSDIASGLGVGFESAQERVENLKEAIADMAAPLPGDTTVYTDLFNAVGGGLARTFKGRAEEFEEVSKDIVKRTGVLASIHGISGTDAGSVMDRLIQGNGGFRELAINDVIQRNSNFKYAMLDQMAQMNIEVDDWQKQSTETRLKIVRSALAIATPDELIKKFDNTFESVTQGINTYWFNPLKGVFGVMRKVQTDTKLTTALEAVTEVLSSLVDLGGAIATWGQLKGISFDPMLSLINFLGEVNQLLNGLEYFIRSGGKLPTFNFKFDLVQGIQNLAKSLPTILDGFFESANGLLSAVDLGGIGSWLSGLTNSAAKLLSNLFNNTDWIAIGETAGRLLSSAVRGVINYVGRLDYGTIMSAITGVVVALVKFTLGLLKGICVDFAEQIGSYLGQIWDGIRAPFDAFLDGIQSLIDKVLNFLGSLNPFQGMAGVASSPVTAAASIGQAITNPVGTAVQATVKLGQMALDAVTGKKPTESKPTQAVQSVDGVRTKPNQVMTQDTPGATKPVPGTAQTSPITKLMSSLIPIPTSPDGSSRSMDGAESSPGMPLAQPVAMLSQPEVARPLAVPSQTNKRVSVNTYSPSVNISAPNSDSLGGLTLDALASQYNSFVAQMA